MATVASHILPLEMLAPNEGGSVVQIDGDPSLVVRLEEMGLHAGARIRMIRPGSPCILEINRQRFSFRFDDQATVLVEVSP